MAAKKKRMTQKEKDFNRKYKKELQEKGLIPPDKKRLNRKKLQRQKQQPHRKQQKLHRMKIQMKKQM